MIPDPACYVRITRRPAGMIDGGARAGQWQQAREYQHNAEADGANAERDGEFRGNAAGCRLEGRRTGACLYGKP